MQPNPQVRPGRGSARAAFGAVAVIVLWLVALVVPVAAHDGSWPLRQASVSPRTATPTTPVTFAVTYVDGHGGDPAWVRAVVDGHQTDMARGDGAPATGVRYALTLTLPAGTHSVGFAARAGNRTITLPLGQVHVRRGEAKASPTPCPTRTPEATRKPEPTPTPAGARTPEPARTPQPARTPEPTRKPTPTPTSEAPRTPEPTPTADPAAPAATPTPAATRSPERPVAPGAPVAQPTPRHPSPTPRPTKGAGSGHAGDASGSNPTTAPAGGVLDAVSGDDPAAPGGAAASGGGASSEGAAATTGRTKHASPAPVRSSSQLVPVRAEASGGGVPGATSAGALATLIPFTDAFGPSGSPARMIPVVMLTSTTTTLAMAFLAFGRRRRDEEPPSSDADLAAAAAAPYPVLPTELVPAYVGVDPGTGGTDIDLPRWRRPSLLAARASNPAIGAGDPRPRLLFDPEDAPQGRRDRLFVRYRIVKLLDEPDELLGNTVGQLDAGDEVEVLENRGTYRRVLTPEGRSGWVHRMVLSENPDGGKHDADGDDGPDLLSAYLLARGRR